MLVKSRNILMTLAGSYLIYIGARLVMQTRQSHPQNETLFVAFGVGFAVFGALVVLCNLWEIWKDARGRKKKEDSDSYGDSYVEMLEFDEEPEPVTEKVRKRKNHVQIVKVEKEQEEVLDIQMAEEELRATEKQEEKDAQEEDTEDVVITEVKIDIRDAEPEEEESTETAETLEELELSPDEAEDAFPTEEIKLERI